MIATASLNHSVALDFHTAKRHKKNLLKMSLKSGGKWNLSDFSTVKCERVSASGIEDDSISLLN